MSLAATVKKIASKTGSKTVTRRTALVYDGTGPNPSGVNVETVVPVVMHIQLRRDRPVALLRAADGDETTAEAKVFVEDAALDAVGWTELQIAPNEDADGPPGDLIDWKGRRYEVIKNYGWDESLVDVAGFNRYDLAERGATP